MKRDLLLKSGGILVVASPNKLTEGNFGMSFNFRTNISWSCHHNYDHDNENDPKDQ